MPIDWDELASVTSGAHGRLASWQANYYWKQRMGRLRVIAHHAIGAMKQLGFKPSVKLNHRGKPDEARRKSQQSRLRPAEPEPREVDLTSYLQTEGRRQAAELSAAARETGGRKVCLKYCRRWEFKPSPIRATNPGSTCRRRPRIFSSGWPAAGVRPMMNLPVEFRRLETS